MEQYSREQYWQLFDRLPAELKDLILSEETAKDIYDICERNELDVLLVPEIARYTGRVLMGVLPPEDFRAELEKKVGLKKVVAKKVTQEIHRYIFFPVRSLLAELYRMEIGAVPGTPVAKPPAAKPGAAPEVPPEAPPAKEKPKKPDVYREAIE